MPWQFILSINYQYKELLWQQEGKHPAKIFLLIIREI